MRAAERQCTTDPGAGGRTSTCSFLFKVNVRAQKQHLQVPVLYDKWNEQLLTITISIHLYMNCYFIAHDFAIFFSW